MSTRFSGTPEGEIIALLTNIRDTLKKSSITEGRTVTTDKGKSTRDVSAERQTVKAKLPQKYQKQIAIQQLYDKLGVSLDDVTGAINSSSEEVSGAIRAHTAQSIKNTTSIVDAINNWTASSAQHHQELVGNTPATNDVVHQIANAVSSSIPTQPVATPAPIVVPAPVVIQANPVKSTAEKSEKTESKLMTNQAAAAEYLTGKVKILSESSKNLTESFTNLQKFIDATSNQFFGLAIKGMGDVNNMLELNAAALKSGISVADYTKMFVEHMSFAARSGSIAKFDAITSANDGYLASVGVFSKEAKNFQITAATIATDMGIEQSRIPGMTNNLIRQFETLSKTVSMTSDEFLATISKVAERDEIYAEMNGLSQRQRTAKLFEITQAYNFGRSLGLAAKQSDALGDAMLKQRNMSVEDRFSNLANIQRMASLSGNLDMLPELRNLQLKSQRTGAEEDRLTQLYGKLYGDTQAVYNNNPNNLSLQAAIEDAQKGINGDILNRMKIANRGALADDSAAKGQEAFGHHVNSFGQAVGKFETIMKGFKNNELVAPLGLAVAGAFTWAYRASIGKLLSSISTDITATGFGGAYKNLGTNISTFFSEFNSSTSKGIDFLKRVVFRIKPAVETVTSVAGDSAAQMTEVVADASRGRIAEFRDIGGKVFKSIGDVFKNGWNSIKNAPDTLSNFSQTVKSAGSSVVDSLKSGWDSVKGVKDAVASKASSVSKGFSDAVTKVKSVDVKSIGQIVSRATQGTADALKVGVGATAKGLSVLPKLLTRIPLIGWIISGVMELFTGDLRDAMSPSGTLMNTIGSMLTATLYGVGDLIVGILEWVFGERMIKPVRQALDLMAATFMAGINSITFAIASSLDFFTSMLPDDSKLNQMVAKWKKSSETALQENVNTMSRVMDGENLKQIGEANRKVAKNVVDGTNKSTEQIQQATTNFNKVQTGLNLNVADMLSQANGRGQQASPGQQQQQSPSQSVALPEQQQYSPSQKLSENTKTSNATVTSGKTEPIKTMEELNHESLVDIIKVLNKILAEERIRNSSLGLQPNLTPEKSDGSFMSKVNDFFGDSGESQRRLLGFQ